MTATVHTLVAGAIASKIPNPPLACLLAFTSHYMLDSIPHWDIGTDWRKRTKRATGTMAILEMTFGLAIGWYAFSQRVAPVTLILVFVASLIPDWLETPWYIFYARQDKKEPAKNAGFFELVTFRLYKIQNTFHSKTTWFWGILTQVIAVWFFLTLLQ